MRFLIDAQLPRRLARLLRAAGHDALHTLDLPLGNRTSDHEINMISLAEQRVVVTKDADFVDSFVLHKQPWKLLVVSTGNVSNEELEHLMMTNLDTIIRGLSDCDYVEVSRTHVILHT